jgi:hypothetical protein
MTPLGTGGVPCRRRHLRQPSRHRTAGPHSTFVLCLVPSNGSSVFSVPAVMLMPLMFAPFVATLFPFAPFASSPVVMVAIADCDQRGCVGGG